MFEKWRRPGRHPKSQGFKRFLSYTVFGIICLVFVFFLPLGTQILGEGVVAHIGHEVIRAGDFRFREENIKADYRDRRPIPSDDEQALKMQQEIRNIALQQLINTWVIHQRSLKNGFSLSEIEIKAEIKSQPAFQDPKTGRFLYSKYLQILKNSKLNPARFEAIVRKSKTAENWQEIFQKVSASNRLERQKDFSRQKYQLSLRYVLMSAEDLEEELLISTIESGDQKQIKQFLKQYQLKWEETGWFSPISSFRVPVSRNQSFMSAVLDELPNKGLIRKLIRDRNRIYLVDILDHRVEKSPKKDPLAQLLNFEKHSRLHNSWLQLEKQKIKIRISKSFQQNLSI